MALHDTTAIAPGTRYGTRLPDWFDEAVAQWGETQQGRDERLADARTGE